MELISVRFPQLPVELNQHIYEYAYWQNIHDSLVQWKEEHKQKFQFVVRHILFFVYPSFDNAHPIFHPCSHQCRVFNIPDAQFWFRDNPSNYPRSIHGGKQYYNCRMNPNLCKFKNNSRVRVQFRGTDMNSWRTWIKLKIREWLGY
jgi:hypothetical protein